MEFIKTCPILNATHKKKSKLPIKKLITTTKKTPTWFGKPRKY